MTLSEVLTQGRQSLQCLQGHLLGACYENFVGVSNCKFEATGVHVSRSLWSSKSFGSSFLRFCEIFSGVSNCKFEITGLNTNCPIKNLREFFY